MGFVAARAHHKEYGETASLILQMAAEMDISKFEIFTVPGGFQVPDAISDILNPAADLSPTVPSPEPSGASGEPPAWWGQELEVAGVEVDAEGKVYVKALRAEPVLTDHDEITEAMLAPVAKDPEIRAWAERNGFTVAPKGRIAKSVLDAFYAAQE